MLSSQGPVLQQFSVTFAHDDSASDAATYSGCANDYISFNSNLVDFEMPISSSPADIVFTPQIYQNVAGCPIQCTARSSLFPLQTPSYVL